MIPIGRGQRELIIGDRQTGKTAVAIDTIINQKGLGRHLLLRRHRPEAVDGGLGRRQAARVRRHGLHHRRRGDGARSRRRCSSSRPTPASPWASTSATTAATRSSSTTICRSKRWPTASSRCCCAARRAAKPTRATSSTCTRACSSARPRCPTSSGGGSLTALPIIETQAGDVSAYIPTNVISITDGQIFLETDLFYSGVRPGRERRHLGLARRRRGADRGDEEGRRHAAPRRWRSTASWRPSRSSARDLDKATQHQLARGARMIELLKQGQYEPLPVEQQVLILFAGTNGFVDSYPVDGRPLRAELYAFDARRARPTSDDDLAPSAPTARRSTSWPR